MGKQESPLGLILAIPGVIIGTMALAMWMSRKR